MPFFLPLLLRNMSLNPDAAHILHGGSGGSGGQGGSGGEGGEGGNVGITRKRLLEQLLLPLLSSLRALHPCVLLYTVSLARLTFHSELSRKTDSTVS